MLIMYDIRQYTVYCVYLYELVDWRLRFAQQDDGDPTAKICLGVGLDRKASASLSSTR